jgi:hypothetical protein
MIIIITIIIVKAIITINFNTENYVNIHILHWKNETTSIDPDSCFFLCRISLEGDIRHIDILIAECVSLMQACMKWNGKMITHLRCTSITALLIICMVGVFVQVNTSAAQNRDTRIGYQRYRRRHISKPPCLNGIRDDGDSFSSLETKIRDTEFVFTGKVTAEIPSVGNLDPWRRSAGES